jgi:phospholipid/cholesterol/gamma-HCH transport system substrate-binding protein
MKMISERNPVIVGVVGVAVTAVAILVALQYHKLPFIHSKTSYSAYFADAGGLQAGSDVQVSGFAVGKVSGIAVDGPRVRVAFNVDDNVVLGDRTEAAIKTKSLLGSKFLEITPRGQGTLSAPIPIERSTPAYQLPDALGDLTNNIEALNTDELSRSLQTLSQAFVDTPPALQAAVQGLGQFSDTLNTRDAELRNLLVNANKSTKVLAQRSDQVVSPIKNSNALLAQLRTESTAVDQLSANLSSLARQLSGFVADNRQQLHPALDKLNGVLTILANRKERLQESIKRVNSYAIALGEAVSSGPFYNAYVANLLPGQFVQPFVDAAFSDLGLDPHTLLPSQLVDPQVGQPATPPLPMPFPRTGQGGEPRLTVPDAITGKPGDPRYPYREPLPAPPPGGPPPGPPAPTPSEAGSTPQPTPAPVNEPAPGQVAPQQGSVAP